MIPLLGLAGRSWLIKRDGNDGTSPENKKINVINE